MQQTTGDPPGKRGKFVGCTGYPSATTRNLNGDQAAAEEAPTIAQAAGIPEMQ